MEQLEIEEYLQIMAENHKKLGCGQPVLLPPKPLKEYKAWEWLKPLIARKKRLMAKRREQLKNQPKKPRQKKVQAFADLKLGRLLQIKTPLEYKLIIGATPSWMAPSPDLIEQVSYASSNPYFKTEEFRELLIRYRELGCRDDKSKIPVDPVIIKNEQRKLMGL